MRKFLYLLVISLSPTLCLAQIQQKGIDSLMKVNEAYLKQDTNKVFILNQLSSAFSNARSVTDAVNYAQQALALSEKLNNKKFIAESSLKLGIMLAFQTKFSESIKYKERARDIYKELGDNKNYGNSIFRLADDYKRMNESKKALDLYLKAYEIIKPISPLSEHTGYLKQIGSTYLDLGENQKALEYAFLVLRNAEKTNDKVGISNGYFNIANVQYALGNYKESTLYYLKALPLKHELNDLRTAAIISYDIGLTYIAVENFPAAIDYFNKTTQIAKAIGYKALEINSLSSLGDIYHNQGKNDEAMAIYNQTLALYIQTGDEKMAAYNRLDMAKVYIEQKKFDLAEQNLNDAYSALKKQNNPAGRRDALEMYSQLYERMHNYTKSLTNYKEFIAIRDSLTNADLKNQVVKKEMQYEFDKKESAYQLKQAVTAKDLAQQRNLALERQQQLSSEHQKLVLSDKEKSLQRITFLSRQAELENDRKLQAATLQKKTLQAKLDKQVADAQIIKQNETIKTGNRYQMLLLGIALIAILIASLIFYNQYKTRKLNQVILSQKKDLEEINAVKDRMFSIVSHDMRSPVNTLIAFNTLLEDDNLTADKMKAYSREIKKTLNHTSVLMENLLNWSSSQMQGYKPELESHSLKQISEDAIDSVTDRAAQKNISLKNNINVDSRVFADKNMTELIMRNILSNAIKYTRAGGIIELMAEQHAGKTTFTITDNGMGMSEDQIMRFNSDDYDYTRSSKLGTEKEKGSGLGLVLCKTFTNMMNGTIAASSEIGKGSTFKITLPQTA